MRRMACVELPRLRLQLLLRGHEQWQDMPVALVSEDRPLAPVLEVNSAAAKAGVQPGMKYATALSVVPDLQAGVTGDAAVEEAVCELRSVFATFSPAVEHWDMAEGVFWLDCEGLSRLWSNLYSWARELRGAVSAQNLYSRIAVGFSRFATFATALRGGETAIVVHESPEGEREKALDMPVRRLPLDSAAIEPLERLGIRTIRNFLDLDSGSLASRFGERAAVLHRFAGSKNELPLQGQSETPSYSIEQELPSLLNREVIASHLAPSLQTLCSRLRLRGRRAAQLTLCLRDERGTEYTETVSPAEPSGDAHFLHKLLLLRIYTLQIGARVVHAKVSISPAQEQPGQALLFTQHDEQGASWARARSLLQAEFGNGALVRVMPCDAHHPGECFRLVPEGSNAGWSGDSRQGQSNGRGPAIETNDPDKPEESGKTGKSDESQVLVRRILFEPQACSGIPAGKRFGPFRVAGRWWRGETGRSYYYVWRESAPALWLYREGERTVLQGYVE